MYQIMRMAEIVRQNGVMIYELIDSPDGKKTTRATKSKQAEDFFWHTLKVNNPFCFSKTNESPEDIKELMEGEETIVNKKDFDCPFDVFSIEILNGLVTQANPLDDKRIDIACYMISHDGLMTLNRSYQSPENINVDAVFILYQYNDTPYVFLEFCYDQKDYIEGRDVMLLRLKNFDNRDVCFYASNAHSVVISKFTERLDQDNTVGYEKINGRVKIRNKDGTKDILKIKRMIHIAPKKVRKNYSSENKIEVTWSHRFWRRGHWAHFWIDKEKGLIDYSKLGKNRDGVYCVKGKTWRVETVVGDEHLPLVSKVRVIEE